MDHSNYCIIDLSLAFWHYFFHLSIKVSHCKCEKMMAFRSNLTSRLFQYICTLSLEWLKFLPWSVTFQCSAKYCKGWESSAPNISINRPHENDVTFVVKTLSAILVHTRHQILVLPVSMQSPTTKPFNVTGDNLWEFEVIDTSWLYPFWPGILLVNSF